MDFVVGFLVGAAVGGLLSFLAGPAIQAWIAHREWVQASREIDAVDRLLERLDAGDRH